MTDHLLEWPPDVFAFTDVVLSRAEASRFALGPPGQWPPAHRPEWRREVADGAAAWCVDAEHLLGEVPDVVAEEWRIIRQRAGTPLESLAQGRDARLAEALLTLHAIADEACAGLGIALDSPDARGGVHRARGRELLVRTGSMARMDPRLLRVLPKVRTPPTGRAALSRYACVQGPGSGARWHKIPSRHRGTDQRSEYARILLLPWPLRVRATDFRPIDAPVQRPGQEPYGFFEFAPQDGLDLDLLDRVLVAAREEAGGVDVVYLPESAVDAKEIDELEALLHRHGVVFLQTGVREHSPDPAHFPGNAIHMGVNPALEKGGPLSVDAGAPWWHIRQAKHHRWSLDRSQLDQYHLGGVLHPHVRWWEATDVPRQTIQFVEVAELTLACLVCEDLAQNDAVAELIRSVGPTVVLPALLDGPQITSRWASRYASGLADDPGSAVLTLTSYGMVQRSRPHGRPAIPVVGLWRDSSGSREITLEADAHAVLLTVCMDRATRRSADGRWPVENGTECFDVAVHQVRAAEESEPIVRPLPDPARAAVLEVEELSVLTGWAEAVAEALTHAPERAAAVAAQGRTDAGWRAALRLPRPSTRTSAAIESLRALLDTTAERGPLTGDAVLAEAGGPAPEGETSLDGLVRHVLVATLEERRTRLVRDLPVNGTEGNTPIDLPIPA